MHNEFTSIIEKDGEWFVAYSPEISGANGQGRSPEDARENLAEAVHSYSKIVVNGLRRMQLVR